MTERQKQAPKEEKENKKDQLPASSFVARSKRNFPSSLLSDSGSDADDAIPEPGKKVKTTSHAIFGTKATRPPEEGTIQLPVLRIQPSLGGGKEIRFPITPRATLIELKDFILFSLNIPHFQQVLTFKSPVDEKRVSLAAFPETVLLSEIPGLIDEVTGYAALITLSFKMSSGLDLTPYGDVIDSESEDFSANAFEFDSASAGPGSELAASLAALIPLPPGTPANTRVLVRSVSKASASNSNLPTLWEVYLPESNIKMLVSAVINIQKRETESQAKEQMSVAPEQQEADNDINFTQAQTSERPFQLTQSKVPKIVITAPEEERAQDAESVMAQMDSLKLASSPTPEPKPFCAHCKVRCRPALRFVCKCGSTFCQTHRYPDKHTCTFDHRAAGLASIQASNPKIVRGKIENI
jgi:hypothetical protein